MEKREDRKTEIISSLLRWIFVAVGIIIFYYPPVYNLLRYDKTTFPLLLSICLVYMTIAQIVIANSPYDFFLYKLFTKGGIIFDYIALLWLVAISGGSESLFFPVTYLLAMHAVIYWGFKGAAVSSFAVAAGYTGILIWQNASFTGYELFEYFMKISILILVSAYGGAIVKREREHFRASRYYQVKASTDYLTGLYNHMQFQETLKETLQERRDAFLVMADIDYFKNVNDRYGHAAGDRILAEVSREIMRLIPPDTGMAFRYGGEELALLLFTQSVEEARQAVERIAEGIRSLEFEFDSEDVRVTVSMGVAPVSAGSDKDSVVACADSHLYRAKGAGRNCIVYDDSMRVTPAV